MKTPTRGLFALAALIAFALGVALAMHGTSTTQPPGTSAAETIATVFDAPRPLPAFALIDSRSQPVRPADLAGERTWLFFGFTACPDVCPATLSIIASALDQLPDAERPRVLMVSVDPERDSPERLGPYVRHFDPAFDALTGSLDQIQALAEGLYATFAKVPLEAGGYTMDHFAGIYFLDERARVVAVSTSPHVPQQLVSDYRAIHAL